jgi:glycosyltransferase involved in cell wall biosynthesis
MSRVVWHLVDAMTGNGDELWGKERVVADVLIAQRESRLVDPRLICFTPGALSRYCAARGFVTRHLEERSRRLPDRSLPRLLAILRTEPGAVLHTHGYKANVVGRLARLAGAPVSRVVATCHGWPDETAATRMYNVLDRWSTILSDAATVPDAAMIPRFPRFARGRVVHIANGVPDRRPPGAQARAEARARAGFGEEAFVAGVVGRVEEEKGTLEVVAAACDPRTAGTIWALAGSGPLVEHVRAAHPSLRALGYVQEIAPFFDALDVYVQASHSEGLSLALLEAMRAGLPIVATDVGATTLAVRGSREALVIPPRDVEALVRAIVLLREDRALAAQLGAAARERFEAMFRTDRQAREFAQSYACAR